ncbi:TadE/TadG family type IV pilus assembly protein [Thalassotalea mangrovi]|uniref:Pilus assembly protein n=1 Tax=Thalassotalea mangrovi TaxID=2572245 RepID=A0A4U1B3S8_9GAMM|nr:TadE family protein [Thalassotalea mangrovi]TKB44230.1 pilus assembly protein [Thalassotalea mangrovi]
MSKLQTQRGVYTVEFAIVGAIFFLFLFAVLEIGRLFFTWNVLTEVSRRGARLATVCNLLSDTSDPTSISVPVPMSDLATFANDNLLPNLSTANLQISYLTDAGTPASSHTQINFVRADIVNYQHQLLIPFVSLTLNSPTFTTVLPRESLGVTRWGYTDCT